LARYVSILDIAINCQCTDISDFPAKEYAMKNTEPGAKPSKEDQARAAQREQAEQWFVEGNTWVGLFEKKDKRSPNFGARIGLPFDLDEAPLHGVIVGKTRAPELDKIPGAAKFVLIAICRDAGEVVREMFHQNPAADDRPRFN